MSDDATEISALAQAQAATPGALLPILHAVQERFGYLPAETAATVAGVLNLSRAEVHGVITFYHLFRTSPPGARTLHLCRAEACQAMGAVALADHVRRTLGVDWHATTGDGRTTLEPIYCLGNCACAPAAMIDGKLHGRLTPARLDALLND